ncbi:MAG: ACT domain-containing protein [Pseudomonadota bacterium]
MTTSKSAPVKDRAAMIAGMAPVLQETVWHFCTRVDADPSGALAVFEETEGRSLVLADDLAAARGYDLSQPMAQITLSVHSALDGVGLTAAVAGALADEGIPCNMVAAFHHDHAFVPWEMRAQAMAVLTSLAERAA